MMIYYYCAQSVYSRVIALLFENNLLTTLLDVEILQTVGIEFCVYLGIRIRHVLVSIVYSILFI